MNKYSFEIGAVVTCFRSDTVIKSLNKLRFSYFKSILYPPDVEISFTHIKENITYDDSSFMKMDSNQNYHLFISHINNLPTFSNSPINTQGVINFLASRTTVRENLLLEINKISTSIFDFTNHRIDHFYTDTNSLSIARRKIGTASFSLFLHDFNALMIHCSCVNFGDKAAIFVAMDEGGKTTTASLCKDGKVLADDQIIFRKNNKNEWLAYGTPWTIFEPTSGSATPKAFFLLEKSDNFSLTKLSSRELLTHLWHEHAKARAMIPKMYHTKILDLYICLSSSAPVYLMKFPKDYIDQEAILKCLDH